MSTRTLDISALRSLVGVATYGGFHKAAAALHLSQAAISRHVQRLEDTLGQNIVERDGRISRFTPFGETVLAHAYAILDAHDTAVAELSPAGQTLTIGAMDHVADALLPDLMSALRSAVPAGTELRIKLGRSARLREAHARGQLDIALVLEGLADTPDEPGAIPTRWIGASDWNPTIGAPVPLVLFDHECGLRTSALQALRRARLTYTVVLESPDLAGIHAAVRAGLGVTLQPALGPPPERCRVIDDFPHASGVVVAIRIGPGVAPKLAARARGEIQALLPTHPSSD